MRAATTPRADHEDRKWAELKVKDFGPLGRQIMGTYKKRHKKGRVGANVWLRDAHVLLIRTHPMLRRLYSDEDIKDKALWCVDQCRLFVTDTKFDAFTMAHGLPRVPGELTAMIRRGSDWHFWQRVIRVVVAQSWDQLMRVLGYVHKHKQIYCSDQVVSWQKGRAEATRRVLERRVGRSNEGDELSLQELQDLSAANPRNRFAELMCRSRGMEEWAATMAI